MGEFEEIRVAVSNGYEAYARYWVPWQPNTVDSGSRQADEARRNESRPIGAVIYQHGIQSHCGWYETSAHRLAAQGYAVLQIDRRGSGRNTVERGHAESAEQLIDDAHHAQDYLLKRSGFETCHHVGVSWGGKLVAACYAARPERFVSLTLVTPGLFPKVGVSGPMMAKIGMAMLYERRRHFDIPLNDPELFTSVPRWQAFFQSDGPTLRQCTAGFFLASRRMDKIIQGLGKKPPIPIHLLLAGDERIVDNGKTTAFIERLDWPETRITNYPTARHSLEFEPDPEPYFHDLVTFINEAHGHRAAV